MSRSIYSTSISIYIYGYCVCYYARHIFYTYLLLTAHSKNNLINNSTENTITTKSSIDAYIGSPAALHSLTPAHRLGSLSHRGSGQNLAGILYMR